MIKVKPIVPRQLRFLAPELHRRAITRTMDQGINAAQEEVRSLTREWSTPPAVAVQRTEYGAVITIDDKRWLFADQGTRPHVILPVRRKFLKFVAKSGDVVFTRRVDHPGTKARYLNKQVQAKVDAVNLAATFANIIQELTR